MCHVLSRQAVYEALHRDRMRVRHRRRAVAASSPDNGAMAPAAAAAEETAAAEDDGAWYPAWLAVAVTSSA